MIKKRKTIKGYLGCAAVAIAMSAMLTGCGEEEKPKKVGEVSTNQNASGTDSDKPDGTKTDVDNKADSSAKGDDKDNSSAEEKSEYVVGDIVQAGNKKIVYMASGDYIEDSEYSTLPEGKKYIFIRLAVENIGTEGDESVSIYDFKCYADSFECDQYFGGDDSLSATLSPGRQTEGCVYFEVPVDAKDIDIEYEVDWFNSTKAHFKFEGDKDSGFVSEGKTEASADAYKLGDIVEVDGLKISYISCETDTSYDEYTAPKEGYHYVTATFEFENTSEEDKYVSSFDFNCYADGSECQQNYFVDNDLSAELSPSRKTSGQVSFEVPDGASVVEMEYDVSYFSSTKVIFSCQ